jgi:hypothetical protein
MKYNFGIGSGAELVASECKPFPKFGGVVAFPVVCDPTGPVTIWHRLMATCAQIQDGESGIPEYATTDTFDAIAIWPAVRESGGHRLDRSNLRGG